MASSARGRAGSALVSIDRVCDEFERNWRAGREPRIEDLLQQLPADAQGVGFRELLAVELELRRQKGEEVRAEEYRQRFADRTAAVDEVFASVVRDLAETAPLSTSNDTTPSAATTSTRYEQLRFFRRGGLGALYRAIDESLHRETIVKFMNEQCEKDPALVAQFKVEAEVTGRLDHPGIVPVYGIGQDWQGRPFYVMRLINGRELKQAIQEYHHDATLKRGGKGRQILFNLLEHLVSACNTVAYAHHVGVVHCDIKPANIMIGKYGETFVLDWGLATNFERTSTFFSPNEPTMRPHAASGGSTSSGQRGGTYGYSSPEQILTDGPIGPTSDVYSLGATLYEIMTGQSPFNGRDPNVRELIRNGEFPPPHKLQSDVCPRLEAICLKAMATAPISRYATAKLLANDVTNWMRDEEITAVPDRWFDRLSRFGRRHRGLTAATFIVLITFIVAGAWIDRMVKTAAHDRVVRDQLEEIARIKGETFEAEKQVVMIALDGYENLCRPFANGEMTNLGVFRPFVETIRNFTTVYLTKFQNASAMQLHTARVYELKATISRINENDANLALKDLREAEVLYGKMPSTPGENRDVRLAQNHLSQGRLLIDLAKWDEARRICQETAQQLQRIRAARPEDHDLSRLLAEAHHCLGEIYLSQPGEGSARRQALIDAEANFSDSKRILEQLSTRGEDSRNLLRDLARSLGWLGDVYLAQGDIPQAAHAYQDSKKHRESLYKSNPDDPEQRFQYARGLGNFGRLERGYRGGLASAIDHLEKAATIQRELLETFPEVSKFATDFGGTENTLAEVYLLAAANEPQRADEFRKKAHDAAETASQIYGRLDQQQSSGGASGLAESLVWLALDGTATAEDARRHAQDAEKRLNTIGPEQIMSGPDLVILAMARSLQGQTEPALRALKLSVQRGENTAYRFQQHEQLALKALADHSATAEQLAALIKKMRDALR